jgi:hypothetical protein
MYLCVRGIDIASFYDLFVGLYNCSDSVGFSVPTVWDFLFRQWGFSVPTVWDFLFWECVIFCSDSVGFSVPTVWDFLFRQCGVFCSDSVGFSVPTVGFSVPTVWDFLFWQCGIFCSDSVGFSVPTVWDFLFFHFISGQLISKFDIVNYRAKRWTKYIFVNTLFINLNTLN